MPIGEWVPLWYQAQNADNKRLIHILMIAIVFFAIFKSMFVRYWQLIITFYSGVIFWFFTAPDFRFGFGFIGFGVMFSINTLLLVLYNKLKRIDKLFLNRAVFVYAIYMWVNYSVNNLKNVENVENILVKNIFVPSRFFEQHNFNTYYLNHTEFYRPMEGDWCGYKPFPCAPYQNPLLQMRGVNMEDGFRIKIN